MTDDIPRRTMLKGAAATGFAATGLAAFGGSAMADSPISVTAGGQGIDPPNSVKSSSFEILRGNPNADFQEINVDITGNNQGAGPVTGTVSGKVLPNKNANENAVKEFNVPFEAPVTSLGTEGNPRELIRLEIPDLFLDVLGLQISLDLELLVTCDPEGGLLGQLLCGLLLN